MSLKSKIIVLTNYGISNGQSFVEKRRIKTLNILNAFVILSLLAGATNGFITKSNYPIWAELTFLALAFFSIFLNKINKQTLSFLIFTLNINLSVFFVSEYYPVDVGNYLYYFPFIISIVLLNNPTKFDRYTATHLIMGFTSFLLSIFIEVPSIQNTNFSPEEIKLIWYYNIVFSIFSTAVLSILLSKLIHDQNKEILASLIEQQKSQQKLNITLTQKETLLAELHHRVKNNLAIISGLLNLQEDATTNLEAKQAIAESKNRIMSMALVHKMLYNDSDFKTVNVAKYSNVLLLEIFNSYKHTQKIELDENYDNIEFTSSELIPYGLILNEIITNSIKYAFNNNPSPKLSINVKKNIQTINLVIKDNGIGFPANFNAETDTTSLGISLIKTLSNQLDGEAKFFNDNGAKIEINFQFG